MLYQLDSENADRDLTSSVTCLTDTPNVTRPIRCVAVVNCGDGTKDLDTTVDDVFKLDVLIGSQLVRKEIDVFATVSGRARLESDPFVVPANTEVIVKVTSPNPADTDVDVTAILYQIDEPSVAIAGSVNDASGTATDFDGDSGLSATDDFYNNSFLVFIEGPNAGHWRLIRDYTGSSKNFAFTGDVWPSAPNNGDKFIITGNAPA